MLVRAPHRHRDRRSARAARCRAAIVKHTVPCGVAERADRAPRRCATRSTPIRSRPTAGSSRSTARSIWRRPKRWPSSSSRSSRRRRSTTTRWRGCERKKNLRIMRYDAGDAAADRRGTARALGARRRAGRGRRSGGRARDLAGRLEARSPAPDEWRDLDLRLGHRAAREVQRRHGRARCGFAGHLCGANQSRECGTDRRRTGRRAWPTARRAPATASSRSPTV